ncbi:MAG: hypothetical protein WCO06_07210 [Candidatus Roizmanbacteria bacterium]
MHNPELYCRVAHTLAHPFRTQEKITMRGFFHEYTDLVNKVLTTESFPADRIARISHTTGGILFVEDIHSRPTIIQDIGHGKRSFSTLEQGGTVAFLGDLNNSENERHWNIRTEDYDKFTTTLLAIPQLNQHLSKLLLQQELLRSIITQTEVFKLMLRYPGQVLWLRGNHDRICKPDEKFIKGGKIVSQPMAMYSIAEELGEDDFIQAHLQLTERLPLMAIYEDQDYAILASHAAPDMHIIPDMCHPDHPQAHLAVGKRPKKADERTLGGLTWTENRENKKSGLSAEELHVNVIQTVRSFVPNAQSTDWIIGHRPSENGIRLYEFADNQVSTRLTQIDHRDTNKFMTIFTHPLNNKGVFVPSLYSVIG